MAQTLTYFYPVAGTVVPTILQALGVNMITAKLNWSDSETTALFTHNFQLSTAQLANLWPIIDINIDAASTTTVMPILGIALTNSSVVTISKPTTVGTQGTLILVLLRPFSEIT